MRGLLRRSLLVACLFVFLEIVLGGALHLSAAAALLAAASGTPVLIAGAHRLIACLAPRPGSDEPNRLIAGK